MVGIFTTRMSLSSLRRRPWSVLCTSHEAFRRFRTLGTSSNVVSPRTADSSPCANSVGSAGHLCHLSFSDTDTNVELIMVGSVPTLYKNQPFRHTALGTVINPKRHISKFASHTNSSWSAENVHSSMTGVKNHWVEFSLPTQLGKKRKFAPAKMPWFGKSYSTAGAGANCNSDLPQDLSMLKGFDICLPGSKILPPVPQWECTSTDIFMHKAYASKKELRPGMVLIKNHVPYVEQVEIVTTCRTLGAGPGGFYQPVDKDGAKLDLQMMCLGLNWDPERLTYEFIRSFDGCEVPSIPPHFLDRSAEALHDAHRLYQKYVSKDGMMYWEKGEEDKILPLIWPNVCIVNFYSAATGRLGLHQDCSESRRSLSERLSVVSISVGDSAEFLYGDERDESKAEKVILESGDVLIFGGESRHMYHGVRSIIPNTAPEKLLKKTGLRPGRLSLTFREA